MINLELTPRLAPGTAAQVLETALLVVSELVTNAVRAASHQVVVAMQLHRDELSIGVTDTGAGWPQIQPPRPDAARGRGLLLVDAVTAEWGVTRVPGGKTVWARLHLPAPVLTLVNCDR